MKPIVGMSLRVICSTDYREARDAISHDWIRYLDDLQVTPILIPNTLRDPVSFVKQVGVQALLLTGGGDVSVQAGEDIQPNEPTPLEELRDSTEQNLLDWALQLHLPVLGVCRGMQALNVYFGGQLIRDINDFCGTVNAHVGTCHQIQFVDADYRHRLEISSGVTNSFHRQAVTPSTLSSQLCPFALSSDGIVEGLYHPHLPIVGIQWHPERANSATDVDKNLIETWLDKR